MTTIEEDLLLWIQQSKERMSSFNLSEHVFKKETNTSPDPETMDQNCFHKTCNKKSWCRRLPSKDTLRGSQTHLPLSQRNEKSQTENGLTVQSRSYNNFG